MSRTRKIRVPLLFLVFGLALSGCAKNDPFERVGIWKPSGVNEANIAAMVANPADLARGRGNAGGRVRTTTTPVERLWQGASQQRAEGQGQTQGGARSGGEAPR